MHTYSHFTLFIRWSERRHSETEAYAQFVSTRCSGDGQQGRLQCWCGTPIPDDTGGEQTSDNKASRQALLRASKSQPLLNIAGGNPMRQQSKLTVQLTGEEFTTSDPTLLYQPTNEAEALKEQILQNVSLNFGKM